MVHNLVHELEKQPEWAPNVRFMPFEAQPEAGGMVNKFEQVRNAACQCVVGRSNLNRQGKVIFHVAFIVMPAGWTNLRRQCTVPSPLHAAVEVSLVAKAKGQQK
jgi:hypothetical protein